MYVLQVNTAASFWLQLIYHRKVLSVAVIFRAQLIYPGHRQFATMGHLNRLMSYDPCMKARELQKIKR